MARRPLAWLILLEALLVAALAAATYHVVSTRAPNPQPAVAAAPPVPAPRTRAPKTPSPGPTATAAVPAAKPSPELGPPPGLNLDPVFWADQLRRINQDQKTLAQFERRLALAVTDWVRAYATHVLLPAVEEAEKPN